MTADEPVRTDIVVVGAGIVGLMITRRLASAGHRVVCVGPAHSEPGTASSAAGAMLGAVGEVTKDGGHPVAMAELDFRVESARPWFRLLPELQGRARRPIVHGRGTVMVANLVNATDRGHTSITHSSTVDTKMR